MRNVLNTPVLEEYKSLLRRQRQLNYEYEAFIEKYSEVGENAQFFPPSNEGLSQKVYIRCCNAPDGNANLVTLPGHRSTALRELRDFTFEAENLIILDPYIFSGTRGNAKEIAQDFKSTARVDGKWLKRIHFICDSNQTTKAVRAEIKALLSTNAISMTESHTDEIHDRVWIANRSNALVVGTSFNGLGSRAAFLLPLPQHDLNTLLEYLDKQLLLAQRGNP